MTVMFGPTTFVEFYPVTFACLVWLGIGAFVFGLYLMKKKKGVLVFNLAVVVLFSLLLIAGSRIGENEQVDLLETMRIFSPLTLVAIVLGLIGIAIWTYGFHERRDFLAEFGVLVMYTSLPLAWVAMLGASLGEKLLIAANAIPIGSQLQITVDRFRQTCGETKEG
jgi:hypothetical protein